MVEGLTLHQAPMRSTSRNFRSDEVQSVLRATTEQGSMQRARPRAAAGAGAIFRAASAGHEAGVQCE